MWAVLNILLTVLSVGFNRLIMTLIKAANNNRWTLKEQLSETKMMR